MTKTRRLHFLSTLTTVAVLATLLVLGGCANVQRMAWSQGAATPAGQPVHLLTVTLRNSYKDRFQPELLVVHVVREDTTPQPTSVPFQMDAEGTLAAAQPGQGSTYLLRMPLDPGRYVIRSMTARARAFPVNAMFDVPVHAPLQVGTGAAVRYLGAIDATVRERQGDEFRAGPLIPLLDQAVAGASGGTFDVVISDRYDRDLPLFRTTFPALGGQNVVRAVLPPFDRARAQAWWQAH